MVTIMDQAKRPRGRPRKDAAQEIPRNDAIDDRECSAVTDIIRIAQSVGNLTQAQADEIERRIRADYGGGRIWIGRHSSDDHCERDDRIRAAYRAGERAGFLARVYGLTQARIYQIVSVTP